MSFNIIFLAVVFNNFDDTYDFCKSLDSQLILGVNLRCVLIDNSDSAVVKSKIDGLKIEFKFVSVLRPEKNLGYFGAFNYFFQSTTCENFDAVVLCNNDLVFSSDFTQELRSLKCPNNVMVICPDVTTIDGVHQNPHVLKPRSFFGKLKLDFYFTHYLIAKFLLSIKCQINKFRPFKRRINAAPSGYLHLGIGACYVLLPSFFNHFNRLDYPHFIYGEEAYLTRQVHSAGGRLYYVEVLKVLHKESATLSKLPSRLTYEYGKEGYWSYRSFY